MSVIQKLRDKYAAVVIGIIALSLVGFILMDAFVGKTGGRSSGNTLVGKVNGEKIELDQFERKLTMQQAMYQQSAPPREQLVGNVWDQNVDEIVMSQEYEKLGLVFTNKELNDNLFGSNPPQWLSQQFTDPKTGQFNASEAQKALAQLKKAKDNPSTAMVNEAINATIINGLRTKYLTLLSNTTYVPKWIAEKSLADQNMIASFSYVTVPYSSIVDSTIAVTDGDIQSYIDAHKEEFKQEDETRSIAYISFSALPTSTDSSKVLNQLASLKQDFANAPDPEVYINRVSSELPYLNGYTLGSKIQVPFADSIKALGIGNIYGPYIDGKNYAIAKMIDKRQMPDSVKVRHILVKTATNGQPALPDSIAKLRIDSISTAIQGGADFNQMVLQYSDDEGSKNTKGEYEFASQQFATISKEFAEVMFYGNTGDKKVVKVENQGYSGYHYMEVLSQKNFETAYKIAYVGKAIEASPETINSASNLATQFAATSRTKKQFDENAAKQNLPIATVPDIKRSDFTLGGLGDNRAFVKWIYENKTGSVSDAFEVADKYVVGIVTAEQKKGLMSVAQARINVEPLIRNEKKALQIINSKFKASGTIEAIAKATGEQILRADSASFGQGFIPNVGIEPKVIGAAFNKLLKGKVSEPIAGNAGVYVVRGDNISAVASTGMSASDLKKQMEGQQKQMGGYRSMEALKKVADIKDNRSDFY